MPTLPGFKPKPRFLKFVTKPTNVGAVELSKAEPVYIDGLPTGGATTIADIAGLQTILDDIQNVLDDHDSRIDALEAAA